jgi:putative ABC transport system permease protein
VVGTLVGVAEVSPGYFDTMGVPLTAGRAFDQRDRMGSTRVVVVNRTMAERFWPGESALGKRFVTRVSSDPLEVIGIVADSKYQTLGEAPQPFFYVPLLQSTSSAVGGRQLLISAQTGSATLAADVRALLREFDPDMPQGDLAPAVDQLGQALWAPRMLATTVTAFGVLALLLAAAGIYGLLAVMVGQRRHEFGLRMTLGASGVDVLRLVVGRGMTWVGVGLVVGLAAAIPVIDLTRSLLFAPETVGFGAAMGAVGVLATVALVACLVPARRAARVDPAVALRGGS